VLVNTELQAEAMVVAVDVGDSVPSHWRSPFAVVGAVQLKYVDSTYPAERDSCWDTSLGCRSMPGQMEEYCCRWFATMTLEDRYSQEELAREFWARLRRMQSYRRSGSSRSKSTMIRVNSENQPGVTRYRRSMPDAAGAKAVKATYHSHTMVVARRDDCNMVRQRVPGFALVISTGDPAFRFEWSSPKRTMD
jgi:hypothetical protein